MHPANKCSHQENRTKVCSPCGKKIVFQKIDPKKFLITTHIEKLIKKYVSDEFDLNDERFPLSICRTCYLTLLDAEKGVFKRSMPLMPNYTDLILPKNTRLLVNNSCHCYICFTARKTSHTKVIRGRHKKRDLQNVIDESNGLYGSLTKNKEPNLPAECIKSKETITVCKTCFQEVGRGIKHPCKKFVANVNSIVAKLPEKRQQQVASNILKNSCSSAGITANVKLTLPTSGRQTRVVVNPAKKKLVTFSEDSLDNFRVNMGASNKEMRKITNFLRCHVGRKSIPINYVKHMSDQSKILEDIYTGEIHEFECEKEKEKGKEKETDKEKEKEKKKKEMFMQKRPVVYADAEELLDAIIEKRDFEGNVLIKVMADGGQGFFKITMSVFPENYIFKSNGDETDETDEDEMNDSNESIKFKKRNTYSEGGSMSKKAVLTSVHRLLLLAIVPKIKESYDNVKLLFELTRLNNIPFKFCSDFKLLLIINGQQTATSTFPCPYCFVSLNYLKGNDNNIEKNCASTSTIHNDILDNPLKLKTYGNLRNDYEKFCSTGKDKKYAKECHSTINLPLFDEADETLVLEKCVLPELHLLQGFVNHLFWDGLVPLLGEEKALIWPKKLKAIAKNYHRNCFEGNACRKMLKEADALNDPQIYENVGIFKIVPYISSFKAMNKIVHCCFTSNKVGPLLESHIAELHNAVKSIENISQTLKIHIILEHIKQSLQFIDGNNGLGLWSEQSGESVHREFLKTWKRHNINLVEDESYLPRFLKAVTEFSSLNI